MDKLWSFDDSNIFDWIQIVIVKFENDRMEHTHTDKRTMRMEHSRTLTHTHNCPGAFV